MCVSNIVAYFTTHTQSQRVEFNWAEIETEAETSRCQANSVVAVCLTASLTTCTHVHVHVWVMYVRVCRHANGKIFNEIPRRNCTQLAEFAGTKWIFNLNYEKNLLLLTAY